MAFDRMLKVAATWGALSGALAQPAFPDGDTGRHLDAEFPGDEVALPGAALIAVGVKREG